VILFMLFYENLEDIIFKHKEKCLPFLHNTIRCVMHFLENFRRKTKVKPLKI